jgi:glycosyltransferase involved in cell wall biosynthesis
MPATGASTLRHRDIDTAQVAILLCTKDGAAFLDEQLASFATQQHTNWTLIVSDDGSRDTTREIVKRFAASRKQRVSFRDGPRKGVAANFLLLATDPTIEADYFAFSDQDDVWHEDKLRRALMWLVAVPVGLPALYCGRTELMTVDGRFCGFSPLFTRPPTFRNALIQNVAGGNTMVFNRAAKKLLEAAGVVEEVAWHDWWVYQLVSAAGGAIRYDPQPALRYRQHRDNLLGSNQGWRARVTRIAMMLGGRFRDWNTMSIGLLRRVPAHLIEPQNREVLETFVQARSGSFRKRLENLRRSGVYRQTSLGNLALLVATMIKKI